MPLDRLLLGLAVLALCIWFGERAFVFFDIGPGHRVGWPAAAFAFNEAAAGAGIGTNQLGFPGRPIAYGPDDFVVVLVGDSKRRQSVATK